jgi:hypothetical protein
VKETAASRITKSASGGSNNLFILRLKQKYNSCKLGHTNLIPWIAGSGQIPLAGGRGEKMLTSGISEQQEENSMIFPRLPLL